MATGTRRRTEVGPDERSHAVPRTRSRGAPTPRRSFVPLDGNPEVGDRERPILHVLGFSPREAGEAVEARRSVESLQKLVRFVRPEARNRVVVVVFRHVVEVGVGVDKVLRPLDPSDEGDRTVEVLGPGSGHLDLRRFGIPVRGFACLFDDGPIAEPLQGFQEFRGVRLLQGDLGDEVDPRFRGQRERHFGKTRGIPDPGARFRLVFRAIVVLSAHISARFRRHAYNIKSQFTTYGRKYIIINLRPILSANAQVTTSILAPSQFSTFCLTTDAS